MAPRPAAHPLKVWGRAAGSHLELGGLMVMVMPQHTRWQEEQGPTPPLLGGDCWWRERKE